MFSKRALLLMGSAASMVPLVYVMGANKYQLCVIQGSSMAPTLNPHTTQHDDKSESPWKNDIVLVKLGHKDTCHRGEPVLFFSPYTPRVQNIKRLIALEGDVVELDNGTQLKIPAGHFWAEGDNKSDSTDSRLYGPVPAGLLTGHATRIVWPPTRWARLGVETRAVQARVLRYNSIAGDGWEGKADWWPR